MSSRLKTIAALALTAATLAAPSVWANEALAKANNCLSCHSVAKKLVGPAFKDIAAKYAGDSGAAAQLAQKVKQGGKGVWGAIPMPANAKVSDADALALTQWILTLK